jgi:hypothetical protein
MTCARPSCGNVVWVDDLCDECARAERHAMYCIAYDQAERDSAIRGVPFPPERTSNRNLAHLPQVVKATCGPGTAYGLAGLRNIIQRLAERGDRNNAMYVAAVQTGELVAGGQLDGAYALDVLREAAEQITPDELWKSKNTIARGVRHGLENPRVPRRAA